MRCPLRSVPLKLLLSARKKSPFSTRTSACLRETIAASASSTISHEGSRPSHTFWAFRENGGRAGIPTNSSLAVSIAPVAGAGPGTGLLGGAVGGWISITDGLPLRAGFLETEATDQRSSEGSAGTSNQI